MDMDLEFRKGILFARLFGKLNKKYAKKLERELLPIIKKNGIKYLVINIENLIDIDIEGINQLKKQYEVILENKGKTFFCGLKDSSVKAKISDSFIPNLLFEVSDELKAINIVNL